MPRLSRRLVAAVLWIAVAMMPLRSLAAAVMPPAMLDMPVVVAETAGHDGGHVAPCHGSASDAEAAASEPSGDTSHTCSLCDLCHSNVTAAAPLILGLAELHEVPPRARPPSVIEPSAPDGVFRPPRATLA
ncbi:MAG: hypothetical protein OEV65_17770 [Aquincola sp.]|nr:hypothetical protein [Aquincola sp.]